MGVGMGRRRRRRLSLRSRSEDNAGKIGEVWVGDGDRRSVIGLVMGNGWVMESGVGGCDDYDNREGDGEE